MRRIGPVLEMIERPSDHDWIFSGEIESVGGAVTHLSPADRVFGAAGLRLGAYGEYVALPARYTIVDKVYPMEWAADAHRRVEAEQRLGAVVIAIGDSQRVTG